MQGFDVSVGVQPIDIPTYQMVSRSALPPLFDAEESLYPYSGYRSTLPQMENRTYQAVVIDNGLLRVTVLPEVGGRILQIQDVKTGGNYLHVNDVIRPVRIPFRWAYISLGIELNFPVAHTPTGSDPVGYELLYGEDGSAGVAVGEKELRWGLCWRADVRLFPGFRGVCLGVRAWNPTDTARDVQWWSNAAQPAGGDTEFIYPNEPVLAHLVGEESGHWPVVGGRDLRWHDKYDSMCGMFWDPTKEDWFGVYHHQRGWGLLHLADPQKLPGKKLWSFGHTGETADWTLAMTRCGDRTCEIQAGVPTLQKSFINLEPGQDFGFTELWLPVDCRDELDAPKRPSYKSISQQFGLDKLEVPVKEIPSPSGTLWKELISAYDRQDRSFLDACTDSLADTWPPTGLDLEPALKWAAEQAGQKWKYQLALWYCATEQWPEAESLLFDISDENPDCAQARAMLGLLLWKVSGKTTEAWQHMNCAIEMLPDGFLLTQANALLREIGLLEERKKLLAVWEEDDFRRRETEAEIALDCGDAEEAIRILTHKSWERHHCRHRRGEIWKAAREYLELPTSPVPAILGEDPVQVDEGFEVNVKQNIQESMLKSLVE